MERFVRVIYNQPGAFYISKLLSLSLGHSFASRKVLARPTSHASLVVPYSDDEYYLLYLSVVRYYAGSGIWPSIDALPSLPSLLQGVREPLQPSVCAVISLLTTSICMVASGEVSHKHIGTSGRNVSRGRHSIEMPGESIWHARDEHWICGSRWPMHFPRRLSVTMYGRTRPDQIWLLSSAFRPEGSVDDSQSHCSILTCSSKVLCVNSYKHT